MKLDWLKSITARIEGRTAIICAGLAFCGFCLWLFVTHPFGTPWVSIGLILVVLSLAWVIVLRPLFAKPQPSEPAAQFLLQQIGNQLVYTGGFYSSEDLVRILREAHNIRPLPPASGLVIGSSKDSAQYKQLSADEAMELQKQDEAGVRRLLLSEAERVGAALRPSRLAGGAAEDTKKLPSEEHHQNG